MPDVGEVAGQAAGNDEQCVDPDVIAVAGIAVGEPLGGDRNTAEAIFVEGPSRRFGGMALLDLDKGEDAPAACDEVNFAAGHAGSMCENPPAVQPKPPGSNFLRLTPACLGKLAVHSLSGQRRNAQVSPSALRFKNVFRSAHCNVDTHGLPTSSGDQSMPSGS